MGTQERSFGEPVVQVRGLTAAFGEDVILEDVNLEVLEGEVFVIIGGSGSGKSTLLKHMIGLIEPRAGEVLIEGQPISSATGAARRAILRRIGVTYQSSALFGSMTLLENVRLPMEEFTQLPLTAMNRLACVKLEQVGLSGYQNHLPAEISGGMQKRAAIARATALDPRILFLDEPSAGLDPVTSAGLDRLILDLSRNLNITFAIVSHELASIFAIADRVIFIDKNIRGIGAEGRPHVLRDTSDNPEVRRFFRRETAEEAV